MTAVDYAFAWGVTCGAAAGAIVTSALLSLARRWRKW